MSAQVPDTEAANGAPRTAGEEGYRVYMGNLPFSATEEQVREHIAKVGGEIISVILPTRFRSRRPAGHAFVTYKNEDDAKKAVEQLNESDFGDRKVSLQLARSKAENAARKEEIIAKRQAAREATKAEGTGETTAVESDAKPKSQKKKAKKPTSRRRLPEEGDETAVEPEEGVDKTNGEKKARKPRKARETRIDDAEGGAVKETAKPKERKPRLQLTGDVSKNTVFVANLPFNVDDDGLAEIFTNLSIKVKSAHVIKGLRRLPNRRPFRGSKGFGFVELEDEGQQQEAVDKVNGSAVGDRKITAKVAQEMKPIEVEQAVEAETAAA